MFNNLKKLCELNGISGRETLVANEIMNQIKDIATSAHIDNLGNVIAFKKGKTTPKNKIMLSAHTDEVGFMVMAVTDEGYIRFSTVGGISPKVIIGRRVLIEGKVHGVIGTKAIHMQDAEERGKSVETDKLLIDIGAKDKEDALKHVNLGDSISFIGDYKEIGSNSIVAKAIDDRAGCAIMIDIMKTDLEFDTYFSFSTQEEVGLRGATVASYTIAPDIAIVVETTASGDVSEVKGEKRVSVVGDGAVISYMDRHTIYDKGLYDLAFSIAKEKDIKVQTKTLISGGNDAGAIHISGKGVRTIAVSIPSKYIHSATCMVDKSDVQAVCDITRELANAVGNI